MSWLRAEDVDWVHLVSGGNNNGDEVSEHGVTSELSSVIPIAEQPVETKKIVLQSFDSEYIKATVSSALLQSGDLESIAQQIHLFVANDQPTMTISRELVEIGKHLLDANPKIGLHYFIAPLVWNNTPEVSPFPCEALAERLVLQNPTLLADDKILNAFANHLLHHNNNNDFTDLEMGFWQRCILTRQLHPAVLEEFLTKLDTSSHTRLLASVVFALIKSNKPALQTHTATLRCVLNRCPPNAPMLAPAKRAFQQIDK